MTAGVIRNKPADSPTARQPTEQQGTASRPAQLARITKRQAPSESRNAMAVAASRAVPTRLRGMPRSATAWVPSGLAWVSSVSMTPGWSSLTRMPRAA